LSRSKTEVVTYVKKKQNTDETDMGIRLQSAYKHQ